MRRSCDRLAIVGGLRPGGFSVLSSETKLAPGRTAGRARCPDLPNGGWGETAGAHSLPVIASRAPSPRPPLQGGPPLDAVLDPAKGLVEGPDLAGRPLTVPSSGPRRSSTGARPRGERPLWRPARQPCGLRCEKREGCSAMLSRSHVASEVETPDACRPERDAMRQPARRAPPAHLLALAERVSDQPEDSGPQADEERPALRVSPLHLVDGLRTDP